MSRIRKEKNCLNCGHLVEDVFCPHCGQKNTETHVNAFHAIAEFVGDYFHADGKFLKSILPLLFRPGYMTNEYNAGKREKFIHPFRLYIFISIVYFSISFFSGETGSSKLKADTGSKSVPKISLGSNGGILIRQGETESTTDDSTVNIFNERSASLPATISEYRDSVKLLPSDKRPSFSDDVMNRVAIKYKRSGDAGGLVASTLEKFKHALPKLLFFLLPMAALLLKILYIRRNRFYIDHLVHTLHLHSFIFLLLSISSLIHLLGATAMTINIAVLLMIIYFFISMKNVYGQSKLKTFFKGVLFSFSYLICLAGVFGLGFLFILIYD